jgi:arylsulfatase A-like enzyme
VFLGAGIEPGRYTDRIRTVDIAPTLAAMLEIAAPDDLDGRDLSRSISIAP